MVVRFHKDLAEVLGVKEKASISKSSRFFSAGVKSNWVTTHGRAYGEICGNKDVILLVQGRAYGEACGNQDFLVLIGD